MSQPELPCVFGSAIQKICPVQTAMSQPNIKKYQRASDPAVQQAKEFGEAMMSNLPYVSLPQFCGICPFLHEFNVQQAIKSEQDKKSD